MRKFLICGMMAALLLTGCGGTEETTVPATAEGMEMNQSVHSVNGNERGVICLENKTSEIASSDDSSWQELVSRLYSVINESEGGFMSEMGRSHYDSQIMGIMQTDGTVCITLDTDKGSKKMLQILEEVVGDELSAFVAEGNKLEAGQAKEKIIGNYGLVFIKNYDTAADLYVTKSSIQLKDAETEKWLQDICKDQLFIEAVSKGDENELYELSTPGFIIGNGYGDTDGVNYQIYRNAEGTVEKVRMVIKSYNNYNYPVDNASEAGAELFAPLQRMCEGFTESASMQQLISDTLSISQGKMTKVKGKMGTARYMVSSHSLGQGDLKMTEVVIEK